MPKPLDPNKICKYVNQLVIPPVWDPIVIKDQCTGKVKSHDYRVTISQFTQQILPAGFPATKVWGYRGNICWVNWGRLSPDNHDFTFPVH